MLIEFGWMVIILVKFGLGGFDVQNHLQLFAQDITEVKEFLKQKGGDIGC